MHNIKHDIANMAYILLYGPSSTESMPTMKTMYACVMHNIANEAMKHDIANMAISCYTAHLLQNRCQL